MWRGVQEEPYILPLKHAAVFRLAAASLSDGVGWEQFADDWCEIGVSVFDQMVQGQKQAAILAVVRALLDSRVEAPEVTAVLGGTVDAIYRELQGNIEIEIDLGETTSVRRMLLDAMEEADYWNDVNSAAGPDDEPALPLSPDSNDMNAWAELVDALRTEVLEDYDFDMEDEFLDMPPEEGSALKQMLGIRPDYFTAVSEDPNKERLVEIRRELLALFRDGPQ